MFVDSGGPPAPTQHLASRDVTPRPGASGTGNGPRTRSDETAARAGRAGRTTGGPTVGYVERNASGRTELRVHGVAGTAPESVLQHPHVEQVAGNRDAGFFRRWWEA